MKFVITSCLQPQKKKNYSEKYWSPLKFCGFLPGFSVDITWESKLNIEPSEGGSNQIADSWNRTSTIICLALLKKRSVNGRKRLLTLLGSQQDAEKVCDLVKSTDGAVCDSWWSSMQSPRPWLYNSTYEDKQAEFQYPSGTRLHDNERCCHSFMVLRTCCPVITITTYRWL